MGSLEIENLSPLLEMDPLENGGKPNSNKVLKEMELNQLDIAGGEGKETTFVDILKNSISETNDQQKEADKAIKELLAGRTKNVHETMLMVERANLSMKLMVQVRNKIIDAYREIMRMQV